MLLGPIGAILGGCLSGLAVTAVAAAAAAGGEGEEDYILKLCLVLYRCSSSNSGED